MNDTVSLARADLYAHDCGGDCEGPDPQPLGVRLLDVFLLDGSAVTIAARVAPPEKGGNYIQMDLAPAEARRLAQLLMDASDEADRVDVDAWAFWPSAGRAATERPRAD